MAGWIRTLALCNTNPHYTNHHHRLDIVKEGVIRLVKLFHGNYVHLLGEYDIVLNGRWTIHVMVFAHTLPLWHTLYAMDSLYNRSCTPVIKYKKSYLNLKTISTYKHNKQYIHIYIVCNFNLNNIPSPCKPFCQGIELSFRHSTSLSGMTCNNSHGVNATLQSVTQSTGIILSGLNICRGFKFSKIPQF
jgi:hypothetical protein